MEDGSSALRSSTSSMTRNDNSITDLTELDGPTKLDARDEEEDGDSIAPIVPMHKRARFGRRKSIALAKSKKTRSLSPGRVLPENTPDLGHHHHAHTEHTVLNTDLDALDDGTSLNCVVARSSLILPFTLGQYQHPPAYWLHNFEDRAIIMPDGEAVPLWLIVETLPYEVAELSRQFRQMVGFSENKTVNKNTWRARRLRMNPKVLQLLFSRPRLWAVQREGDEDRLISRDVLLENVELDIFPLGTGILNLSVNWLTGSSHDEARMQNNNTEILIDTAFASLNEQAPLLLSELRTWLYVAKYRHTIPRVAPGWTFGGHARVYARPSDGHLRSLGTRLSNALYGDTKPMSLNSFGNWLLMFNGEKAVDCSPPLRVVYGGNAFHHSTVVVDREPLKATLREYLFHLRRGNGQRNRPPPEPLQQFGDSNLGSHDKVLIPRANRHFGLSREGVVCITWPTEGAMNLALDTWYRKFQGIYLLLSLHVYAERLVLEELGSLAATNADNMNLDHETAGISEIDASRARMKELTLLVARFTISMSSDDCGGRSEYSEFFTAIRLVFGIRLQRAELREELQDTLALLESGYYEEKRKLTAEEQVEEKVKREKSRQKRIQKEADKRKYENLVSAVTSVTVPTVLVSSVFGMNLVDLPIVHFIPLLSVIGAISVVILICQLWYLKGMERRHMDDD